MSMVRFRLGDQAFALSIESVREVQRMVIMHPVSSLPPEVLGVIDVHGEIVPVLDLRQRLGMERKPPTSSSPLLILNSRGSTLAILVDQIEGVTQYDQMPMLGTGWDCVRGLIELDHQITTLLDADALPTPGIEALLSAPGFTHNKSDESDKIHYLSA